MPNANGIVLRLREKAIIDADLYLREQCNAVRLSNNEFAPEMEKRFTDAWELRFETQQTVRRLQIYIGSDFPFSFPKFLLLDRPPFLTWPHIEENGLLCLVDDDRIAKPDQPAGILGTKLKQALELVCRSEIEENQSDFQKEFHSYWDVQPGLSNVKVCSLLRAKGQSRFVRVWLGEIQSVVGESEREVLIWLRNLFGDKPQFDRTERACLLWLDGPLVPSEYPTTPDALIQLASRLKGGCELVHKFVMKGKPPYYFILGADSESGPCLAAVRIFSPQHDNRKGKVTSSSQVMRMCSADAKMDRMEVERVDAEWVHGRGHDPYQHILRKKHVVIAGCGSVGAPVAQQLAMSGVGKLTLIDYDRLSWANVGRHPLGAQYVGKKKSIALSEFLQMNYPHLSIKGIDDRLESALMPSLEYGDCDLIICATADWGSERVLNMQHVAGEIGCPILYTWTEGHACAGHAVFLPKNSASCLQCGFDLGGKNQFEVAIWPPDSPTERREPACGAVFQPYGSVDLMGTIAIATSLSLDSLLKDIQTATHRIWAGPLSRLQEAGGAWSDVWLGNDPRHGLGAIQEDRTWPQNFDCPVCGVQKNPQSSTLAIPARG